MNHFQFPYWFGGYYGQNYPYIFPYQPFQYPPSVDENRQMSSNILPKKESSSQKAQILKEQSVQKSGEEILPSNQPQLSKILVQNQPKTEKKGSGKWLGKLQKDEDFRHRRQTQNRNLSSNTLKLFLKQLRTSTAETHLDIALIIKNLQIKFTKEEFFIELEKRLPVRKSYISFPTVKEACIEGNGNFEKVFRRSMRRFYLSDIYRVGIGSARTTRDTRNAQIKKGREFLEQLQQHQ